VLLHLFGIQVNFYLLILGRSAPRIGTIWA
jgi:hypothetical protein